MGIIREKFEAFLSLVAAFFSRLCRKSPQQQQPAALPPSPNVVVAISPPLPAVQSSTPSSNAEPQQLLNLLAAQQQRQQWQGAILTFCFSFALGIPVQFSKTTNQPKELPASFVFLCFAVLLIFCILLVALFTRQNHAVTSQLLEKVAVFLTAAAFCHATVIPFPLNLKLTTWALFLVSSFVVAIVPRHFDSIINNPSSDRARTEL